MSLAVGRLGTRANTRLFLEKMIMHIRKLALLLGLCMSAVGIACGPTDAALTTLPLPITGATPVAGGASVAGAPSVAGGTSVGGQTAAGGAGSTAGGETSVAGGSAVGGQTAGGGAPTAGGGAGAGGGMSSGGGAPVGGGATTLSAGCGKDLPPLVTLSKWSEMANQDNLINHPPAIQVPCTVDPAGKAAPPCVGGMTRRGYWVYVKAGYDKSKPSKVIFEAAGCGDSSSGAHGGTSGYPYQDVDGSAQVIQVGLSYSRNDNCYDNSNPKSNDFEFFPILHKSIENQFCVDKTKEYWSGYSTGAWVGNQMTCAFPDVLRGVVFATGDEPKAQPACKSGFPVAGLFLHDDNDTYNPGIDMVPGCSRLLVQNGCSQKTCDFANTSPSVSTVYKPTVTIMGAPPSLKCVSFAGCPATSPVIWCRTALGGNDPSHYIGAGPWVTNLLWDFINHY